MYYMYILSILRSVALAVCVPYFPTKKTANQAMCNGAEKILAGTADIVLAGGAETFSDLPIRFSRPIRCVVVTYWGVQRVQTLLSPPPPL